MAFKKDITRDKATFSLDVRVIEKLEDTWLKLRKKLKGKNISKSIIAEEAIKAVLDDFMKNEETSEIYKALSKN